MEALPEALNVPDTDLFLLINGFVGTAPFVDRSPSGSSATT